jgi:hypothetical protein
MDAKTQGCRGSHIGPQFSKRNVAWHVFHAAIWRGHKPVPRNMCEAVAVSVGDDEGRFDLGMPRSSTPSMIFSKTGP